jgi:hypothetical protein
MPTTITGSTGVSKVQDGVITVEDLNGGGSGSAPVFGCRAWVNFDGTKDSTGATSTANTNRLIRGSGNVTSVLRNGAGNYTITFTTAMPDANYGFNFGFNNQTSNNGANLKVDIYSASNIRVQKFENNINADCASVCVAIFR